MKTYALPQTKELLSIVTDDDGNPRLDTLCPSAQYLVADPAAPWNTPYPVTPEDWPEDQEWAPDLVSHDPADYPGLLWTPPLIVELVKIPKPDQTPGKIAEPILVWTETSCTREWQIRDMTPDELADSVRKTWPTTREFLSEFTMEELAGMSLSTDPIVAALRLILSTWVGPIYSDDSRVEMGLSALQSAGVITPERRDELTTK